MATAGKEEDGSAAGKTVADFLALARGRIDRLDARLLVQQICGWSHARLIAEPRAAIGEAEWQTLLALLDRRAAGEPLAYLVGWSEFRGRRFAVSPAVLIPRPETEELVTLALEKLQGSSASLAASTPRRCVDLGTGSGVIAVSLALEYPQATVCAVDISAAALAVAQRNAAALKADVDYRCGSWFAPLTGEKFDLIVSNPPYIAAGDPHLALNGLPHEPPGALTDGGDGLDCIRAIVAGAAEHLAPGGWLLFEHGYDQGEACRNLLLAAGFEQAFTKTDLAGTDRISGGCRAASTEKETPCPMPSTN